MTKTAFFILSLGLIVVATFPMDLVTWPHAHWRRVAWVPFATGSVRPVDIILNVALYVPFGIYFPAGSWRRGVAIGVPAALALSGTLEFAQVWSHVRFPSATDVAMNVLGASLGLWFTRHRRGAREADARFWRVPTR